MDKNTIRAVFMRNGFTVKEGHDDLKPYVYAAAEELIALARAGIAAPTGQQAETGCGGTGQASNDMPCLGCDNCPEFFSAKEAIAAGQQAEPVAKRLYRTDDFGVQWEVTPEQAAQIDAAMSAAQAQPKDTTDTTKGQA